MAWRGQKQQFVVERHRNAQFQHSGLHEFVAAAGLASVGVHQVDMPPLVGGEQEIEPFEPHVGHGEEPCGAGAVHVVLPGTHYVGMGGTIGIKGAIPADIDALVRDLDAILSIPLEDLPVVVGRGDLDRSHALGDRPVEVGTAIINNEQVYGYVVAGGRNGAAGPA